MVRGYTWTVIPISQHNRRYERVLKLKIKEMGSRYFFICMCVWLGKWFRDPWRLQAEINQ